MTKTKELVFNLKTPSKNQLIKSIMFHFENLLVAGVHPTFIHQNCKLDTVMTLDKISLGNKAMDYYCDALKIDQTYHQLLYLP